ncbi:MAG: N-acetyltransferase family protein [Sneathiellaceae bacterium]
MASGQQAEIRDAVPDDLPQILAIYNEIIATSTAVYSEQPVDLADRRAWLEARRARGFPVLVATGTDGVQGFASFGEWRGAWSGYRHTVEHSVHVAAGHRGAGLGRQLVQALFPRARALGMHVLIGGIDAANEASIRFHARLGFEQVAHFREVGRKFDRWLDLVFMQRFLDMPGSAPAVPTAAAAPES